MTTPDSQRRPLRSAIGKEQGLFLQSMIHRCRARVLVEVGCAHGISSLFIGEALKQVGAEKHIIIDPYQRTDWEGIGLHNLRLAKLDDIVEFHAELSHLCLPRLLAAGRAIDFAFIDAMHTFDYAFVDFYFINQMLGTGGIVFFDDVNFPGIRKVCRYVLTNLPYRAIGPEPGGRTAYDWLGCALGKLPLVRGMLKAEYRVTDESLGIPRANYMAMEKIGADVVGGGTNGTRHWGSHRSF